MASQHCSMRFFSSSESFPCSSIVLRIVSFLFAISESFSLACAMASMFTSSILPVFSLRYREINGMVQPSSSSARVFSTACSFRLSWAAICFVN
ncbi:Uncharacterised protein [Segatella copri]|nr:Uncharacterised protein [Segatella copri]